MHARRIALAVPVYRHPDGVVTETVAALGFARVAIHRNIGCDGWAVTHRQSGYSITTLPNTQRQARDLAEWLEVHVRTFPTLTARGRWTGGRRGLDEFKRLVRQGQRVVGLR